MDKIALLWPNRLKNYERLHLEGVCVFENVGGLNVEPIVRRLPQEGFHAVVCTGGIELEVRRLISLPIYVVTSGYIDVLESFQTLESEYRLINKQIALLVHKNNFLQLSRLRPYVNNYIELFTFSGSEEAKRILQQIISRNFDAVLTGPTGLVYAEETGIPAYPLCYSEESALDSVKQVKSLLELNRKEILQMKRIQSAVDVSPDAIISTDGEGVVNLCNKRACDILHLSQDQVLNHPVTQIMQDPSWSVVYSKGIAQRSKLVKIGQENYFSTRLPIVQDEQIIGSVCTLQEVEQIRTMESKFRSLQSRGLTARYQFDDIIGSSPAMRTAISHARIFAETEFTVLLEGETGTGKELFAQSIHNASPRKKGPFVAINCAALPEALLESELMGYEDGAFTGAKKGGKTGLFEMAHGGTIFLDEINQMPLPLQSKLLRVIQERSVMRIGGNRMIPVDVRIIAAANEDLLKKVTAKQFRSDLYYRINIMRLRLPPLRERKEDIPLLTSAFAAHNEGVDTKSLDNLLAEMNQYNWPGNIRELQNFVWRSIALLTHNVTLEPEFFLEYIPSKEDVPSEKDISKKISVPLGTLAEMECSIVAQMIQRCGGNQSQAARILDVSRNTISNKLNRMSI
ncbi:MAG: sigma 54-interacting transcriptional regulator [Lawsonibacter sp.]|nr:sigma 54-interacting transcriptional regulator [Lawsonibacter sp.]